MDMDFDTSPSDDEEFLNEAVSVEGQENAGCGTELRNSYLDPGNDSEDFEPIDVVHRKRKSVRLEISDDEEGEQVGEVRDNVLATVLYETEQSTAVVTDRSTTTSSSSSTNSGSESASSGEESDSSYQQHQSDYYGSESASSNSIDGYTGRGRRGFYDQYRGSSPEIDHNLARIINEASPKKRKKTRKSIPRKRLARRTRKASCRSRSGNESNDEELDADARSVHSNENASVDSYTGEAQCVSIHKIRVQNPGSSGDSEETIIQRIVDSYNRSHKSAANYVEKHIGNIPEIRQADKAHFQGDEFKIKVYVQNSSHKIGLLNAFGISAKSNRVASLIFYYRQNEIFALTTDHAWNVVQGDSDYFFPMQIAARLLSEKGQLGVTSKQLLGNEISSKKIMKKHQQPSPFDLLKVTGSFVADLRKGCSLTRLECFSGPTKTKIQVMLASVRIEKRLDVCDFASILSHFSVIANGQPTFHVGTPILLSQTQNPSPSTSTASAPTQIAVRPELDTDAHKKDLALIPKDMNDKLNSHLGQLILHALRDPARKNQLYNFNVSHKHYEDYANALKFIVFHNNEECKVFYTMPSLKEIMDHVPIGSMVEAATRRSENQKKSKNFQTELLHQMDLIKLAFSNSKGAIIKTSLVSCLEGPLWWPEDGQVYWLVMSQWCVVRESYLLMVHTRFLDILSKGLLEDRENGYLHVPFAIDRVNQTEDPITSYLRSYEGERRYFTWPEPDSDSVVGSKLFDMIHIGQDNRIYLIYLTESINSNLLSTGTRITRSNLKIQTACRKKDPNSEDPVYCTLKSFYENHLPGIRLYFKTFQNFVEGLLKSRVVYGIGRDELTGTSLIEESQLKTNISVRDIEAVLVRKNKSRTFGSTIHEALQHHQYLESTGSITSKILICTQQSFGLDLHFKTFGPGVDTTFVFEEIVEKYRSKSGYNTFLLKNVFWMIDKDLSDNGSEFFICELPYE